LKNVTSGAKALISIASGVTAEAVTYPKSNHETRSQLTTLSKTGYAPCSAKLWCQTLAAPIRLASGPREAINNSVFSNGT